MLRFCRSRRRVLKTVTASCVDLLETRQLLTALNLTDHEQLLVELINRARANPTAEATRQGISLNQNLPAGTISTAPKQPLAPNQILINVSAAHSADMLARGYFDHVSPDNTTPGQRATAAGYNWRSIAENIAYMGYFANPNMVSQVQTIHGMLFRSSGHRVNIMSPDSEEIGVGIRNGAYAPAGSNATMATEMFGFRRLNPLITGVVYEDMNDSRFYDPGEAVRSGTVSARNVNSGATYTTDIGNSGGYVIEVPAGQYVVTARFTIAGNTTTLNSTVQVEADNVKVDFDVSGVTPITLALQTSGTGVAESGTGSKIRWTVSRTGDTSQPLTVTLTSSDTNEVTVPPSVVIPAGSTSVQFDVSGAEDGLIDGPQFPQITASANGAAPVSANVRVNDRTAPTFTSARVVATASRPEFRWNAIANATSYEITVTNLTTGQVNVIQQAGIQQNSFVSPTDLPIGNYAVRVRGFNSANLASAWSKVATWQVRPRTAILGAGRRETTDSFEVRWNPVPGAVNYDIVVTRVTSGGNTYLARSRVTDNFLVVSDFAIGRYLFTVRARSAQGIVTTYGPGVGVTVSLPVTGYRVTASGLGMPATLRWDVVRGANSYDVQIENLATGQVNFIRNTSFIGRAFLMTDLVPGNYRARVRPKDAAGVTHPTVTPFNFLFDVAPRFMAMPATQPSRPVIRWQPVAGATRYELVIATSSMAPVITQSQLTDTQYQPDANLAPGNYRVWLKAFDDRGKETLRSGIFSFTVAASADSPSSLLRPDDEEAGIRHISADDLDSVFSHFDSLPFAGHRISEDSEVFDVPPESSAATDSGSVVREEKINPSRSGNLPRDSEAMSLPV